MPVRGQRAGKADLRRQKFPSFIKYYWGTQNCFGCPIEVCVFQFVFVVVICVFKRHLRCQETAPRSSAFRVLWKSVRPAELERCIEGGRKKGGGHRGVTCSAVTWAAGPCVAPARGVGLRVALQGLLSHLLGFPVDCTRGVSSKAAPRVLSQRKSQAQGGDSRADLRDWGGVLSTPRRAYNRLMPL